MSDLRWAVVGISGAFALMALDAACWAAGLAVKRAREGAKKYEDFPGAGIGAFALLLVIAGLAALGIAFRAGLPT